MSQGSVVEMREANKIKLRTIKNINSGIKFDKTAGNARHLSYCPNKISVYNIILIDIKELDPQDQISEYKRPHLAYIHGIGTEIFNADSQFNCKFSSEQWKVSIEEATTICEFISHVLEMDHKPQSEYDFDAYYTELEKIEKEKDSEVHL